MAHHSQMGRVRVTVRGRAITVKDGLGEDYLVKQYLQLHGIK
jgi:hypothetical protein